MVAITVEAKGFEVAFYRTPRCRRGRSTTSGNTVRQQRLKKAENTLVQFVNVPRRVARETTLGSTLISRAGVLLFSGMPNNGSAFSRPLFTWRDSSVSRLKTVV